MLSGVTEVRGGVRFIAEQGEELLRCVLDVASGRKQPYSGQYRRHNDICIFNPAPSPDT